MVALGFGSGRIRTVVSMATKSSHRHTMGSSSLKSQDTKLTVFSKQHCCMELPSKGH